MYLVDSPLGLVLVAWEPRGPLGSHGSLAHSLNSNTTFRYSITIYSHGLRVKSHGCIRVIPEFEIIFHREMRNSIEILRKERWFCKFFTTVYVDHWITYLETISYRLKGSSLSDLDGI